MKSLVAFIAAGCLAIAWESATATESPDRGTCISVGVAEKMTVVRWDGASATVTDSWGEHVAVVVGLRPHDASFKLSIIYMNPLSAKIELVIFGLRERYRMGIVHYDYISQDQYVIESIWPFEEATCVIG